FCVVRIAGERRRRESLLHGAVAWGLSAVFLAVLAVGAFGSAANTAGLSAGMNRGAISRKAHAREAVRGDPGTARLTPREQIAVEDAAAGTAKALGFTAGALALSFLC